MPTPGRLGRLAHARLGLLALAIGSAPATLHAEGDRPAYSALRYSEDWSSLAAAGASAKDAFDPLKYVPLSADASIWASFGGQLRERFESWNNFSFLEASDDTFWLTRLRLHADFHATPRLRAFIEGKWAFSSSRQLPGGRRSLEADSADIQNAFVDAVLPLGSHRLTFRTGRQELLFGRQRLVSPLDWSNTRRTFDGASASFAIGDWKLSGFWTLPVAIRKYEFNSLSDDQQFYGIYANGKRPQEASAMDLYFLGLKSQSVTFNATSGDEERFTLGLRLFGKAAKTPLDYDLEGAYQFGGVGSGNIRAFLFAAQVGYAFAQAPTKPSLFVGFDYASGDQSPGGDVETFNQLFPLGHAYLGFADMVGHQNIFDASLGGSVKPHPKLTTALSGHCFWRARSADALYNASGGVVRNGSVGSAREVGLELDLTATLNLSRHWQTEAGYSRFFPGEFIDESGESEPIDFAYVSLQFTF